MIYVRIKEILKEEKKSKYWFVKQMEGSYKSLSNLIDNKSTRISFDTLEKACYVLDREPGEVIIIKKRKDRRKK